MDARLGDPLHPRVDVRAVRDVGVVAGVFDDAATGPSVILLPFARCEGGCPADGEVDRDLRGTCSREQGHRRSARCGGRTRPGGEAGAQAAPVARRWREGLVIAHVTSISAAQQDGTSGMR